MKWFFRIWHRFTLGRTALEVPITYRNEAIPGTVMDLAYRLLSMAFKAAPRGCQVVVCVRDARDLRPRQIRIVIEVNQ